jgi:hypothetical protein
MGLTGFFGVFGFDEGLQVREVQLPEVPISVDPGIDGAERLGIQLINAVTAFAVFADQMGAAEKAQVLGNGGAGDGKGLGNFTGRLAAAAEQIEDGTAGGVGQSLESGFGGICNRTVPHNA